MRTGVPSRTALGVALARSRLDRPATPTGDVDADQALAGSLLADAPENYRRRIRAAEGTDADRAPAGAGDRPQWRQFGGWITTRTRFFDDAVLEAVADQVPQIVLLGAGYDTRALRFRTPGVRFFEVDHPATQTDKRARLDELAIVTDDITFVSADFTEPGLADRLDAAGHRSEQRSLLIIEGVLRYLPEQWFHQLLSTAAERAAAGSRLAVSISTADPDEDLERASTRQEREQNLAASGEPVLTVPERADALRWLEASGWSIESVRDVAETVPDTRPGRLLVRARR
jgi:methyltransferase (TIGR00027 family)